jgi:hypothetical protein
MVPFMGLLSVNMLSINMRYSVYLILTESNRIAVFTCSSLSICSLSI